MKKLLTAVILVLWSLMLHGSGVIFIVTADLHGNLKNFARLAPEIRRYPEAVKIDLGDIAQGNFAVVNADALPVLECFNFLEYDILVPGNHDLEFPESTLKKWQKYFRGKILGAQWQLGGFKMPGFTVVERQGYRIGIIALGAVNLKRYSRFWRTLIYRDEADAVKHALEELNRYSCDAYLLVGHIGAENFGVLYNLLRDNPEINAFVGSHSHREVPGGRMGDTLSVQPGPYASSAIKLEMVFDDRRQVKYIRSSLIYPQKRIDPVIMAVAGRAEENSASAGDKVLGEFRTVAEFGKTAAGIIRQVSGADAAVAGIETAAFRNKVTGKVLFKMMPYGNRIAVVTLSRKQLLSLMRRKRGGCRYFGAGDFSGELVKVAVSDFVLSQMDDPPEAEIGEKFERLEIEKALKSGNMRDFEAE